MADQPWVGGIGKGDIPRVCPTANPFKIIPVKNLHFSPASRSHRAIASDAAVSHLAC